MRRTKVERAAVPMTKAHIITGSFGAGKTTAIRHLMANKPTAELWIVILNEFTDAGIDALQVAEAARGSYDVRLISGGCLCCVGEVEFSKQLRDILRSFSPTRLLIEPSGAGHAADIVDALGVYEKQRALSVESIVCLVDARDAVRILERRPANEWSQIQSADVLLLSKPDLAAEAELHAFEQIRAAQFPVKPYVGVCRFGELPAPAMQCFTRQPAFSLLAAGIAITAHESSDFPIMGLLGSESRTQQLGLWAVQWQLPSQLTFSRALLQPRLEWLLHAHQTSLRRMKAIFRTGSGPSWMVQSSGHGLEEQDSAYRRDSRVELVLTGTPTSAFLDAWRALLHDAANPPRT